MSAREHVDHVPALGAGESRRAEARGRGRRGRPRTSPNPRARRRRGTASLDSSSASRRQESLRDRLAPEEVGGVGLEERAQSLVRVADLATGHSDGSRSPRARRGTPLRARGGRRTGRPRPWRWPARSPRRPRPGDRAARPGPRGAGLARCWSSSAVSERLGEGVLARQHLVQRRSRARRRRTEATAGSSRICSGERYAGVPRIIVPEVLSGDPASSATPKSVR